MSLIHWWPLNGNLNDIGTKNGSIVVTNQPSTQYISGKIGQCYNFNGGPWMQISGVSVGKDCSICAWAKSTTNGTMLWGMQCAGSDYLNLYNSGSMCLNVGDGDDNPFRDSNGNNVPYFNDNIWHHFVVVFKGDERAKLYIDGIYRGQAVTYRNPTMSNQNFTIGTWNYSSHGYYWNGGINDVRIYDHALSAKEIHEISKGLILHYDFNDPYAEPTTNLISSVTSGNAKLPVAGNGVDLQITSGDAYCSLNLSNALVSGTTYTLSFDVSNLKSDEWVSFGFYDSGMHNATSIHNGKTTITFTAWNTASNLTFDDGGRTNTTVVSLRNFQLEQKDHATPWVMNGTTRPTGLICDCSGYGRDGTQVNLGSNLKIVKGISARGQYYGKFDASCAIDAGTGAMVASPLTINMFVYRNNWNDGTLYAIASCTEGGGWNFNTADVSNNLAFLAYCGGSYKMPAIPLSEMSSGWHMVTGVVEKDYVKIYLDGVLKSSVASGGSISYPSSHIFVGVEANGASAATWYMFPGLMADFKIYSTALSASDVLAEYQNKAVIDKNGNLFTSEFIEGNVANIKVKKASIVAGNNFVEGTDKVKFSENYIQLEYLEFSGTSSAGQFIRTGITSLTHPFSVRTIYNKTNTEIRDQTLVGQRQLGKYVNIYDTYYETLYGSGGENTAPNNQITSIEVRSAVGVIKNDSVNLFPTTSTNNQTSSYELLIGAFSESDYTEAKWFFNGHIYEITILNNGELYRHFIPAKRKSDNVLGLYDLVNRVFYTNAGSGSFVAGPEVNNIAAIYSNELIEN